MGGKRGEKSIGSVQKGSSLVVARRDEGVDSGEVCEEEAEDMEKSLLPLSLSDNALREDSARLMVRG